MLPPTILLFLNRKTEKPKTATSAREALLSMQLVPKEEEDAIEEIVVAAVVVGKPWQWFLARSTAATGLSPRLKSRAWITGVLAPTSTALPPIPRLPHK
jgi:hypothetical protein